MLAFQLIYKLLIKSNRIGMIPDVSSDWLLNLIYIIRILKLCCKGQGEDSLYPQLSPSGLYIRNSQSDLCSSSKLLIHFMAQISTETTQLLPWRLDN